MKKILATILTLVILLSVAPSVGTVAGAAASEKPFYALTWSALNGQKFDNIDMAYLLTVKPMGDKLTLNGYTDSVKLAQTVKAELDSRPEGMRYIRIFETDTALKWDADLVIYADGGVKELKRIFSSFVDKKRNKCCSFFLFFLSCFFSGFSCFFISFVFFYYVSRLFF